MVYRTGKVFVPVYPETSQRRDGRRGHQNVVNVSRTAALVASFEPNMRLRPSRRSTAGQTKLVHHRDQFTLVLTLLGDHVRIQHPSN